MHIKRAAISRIRLSSSSFQSNEVSNLHTVTGARRVWAQKHWFKSESYLEGIRPSDPAASRTISNEIITATTQVPWAPFRCEALFTIAARKRCSANLLHLQIANLREPLPSRIRSLQLVCYLSSHCTVLILRQFWKFYLQFQVYL